MVLNNNRLGEIMKKYIILLLIHVILNGCWSSDSDNLNETGTSTPLPPTVETLAIENILSNSARSGGIVTAEGSSIVTARGVCWDTTLIPTTSNSKTTDGSGTGNFTSQITGLRANTTYTVRAYAINNAGTSYGSFGSFRTSLNGSSCTGVPTVTYQGKTYNTIQIGGQCWLKENLDVGVMIQGTQAQSKNETVEKYCYDNKKENCDTYGGLYQWNEAMAYSTTPGTKGICPDGFHIPTTAEFETLKYSSDVSNNSTTLKAIGQGTGSGAGTNTSDFSALLAGYRDNNGSFYGLGGTTTFWSSTEYISLNAYTMYLYHNNNSVYMANGYMGSGVSVRCIKD